MSNWIVAEIQKVKDALNKALNTHADELTEAKLRINALEERVIALEKKLP
jgi:polyhydroxyalkanoate synthesis regulator phasin